MAWFAKDPTSGQYFEVSSHQVQQELYRERAAEDAEDVEDAQFNDDIRDPVLHQLYCKQDIAYAELEGAERNLKAIDHAIIERLNKLLS